LKYLADIKSKAWLIRFWKYLMEEGQCGTGATVADKLACNQFKCLGNHLKE
jgi:hypothetical protein